MSRPLHFQPLAVLLLLPQMLTAVTDAYPDHQETRCTSFACNRQHQNYNADLLSPCPGSGKRNNLCSHSIQNSVHTNE
jgi:hypothetical protein